MTQTISTPGNQAALANASVAVVVNTNDPDSVVIGAYYVAQRPGALTCNVACAAGMPPLAYTDFNANVLAPVRTFLGANPGAQFLATTKGISAQTDSLAGGGGTLRVSTDSELMNCLKSGGSAGTTPRTQSNPFCTSGLALTTRFSRSAQGFPLITRLDAATRTRALQLIDNATAARPWHGIQLINPGNGGGNTGVTNVYDGGLFSAIKRLRAAGDTTTACTLRQVFETRYKDLMGWYSYAIYSPGWSTQALAQMQFLPGCLMAVINSYSGFSLYTTTTYGHVQPETLIPVGITGAHCSVEEPNGEFPDAGTMFGAYRAGFTLAESLWAASYELGGKSVILGDPLCAPYHS